MDRKPTTSITHISSLFTILESQGIDVKAFLVDAGVDPSILKSPENRLTWETVQMLTHRAVQITGNAYFGLHQGESMVGFSNILGHILVNCQTLGEALEKLLKFYKILYEGCDIIVGMEGEYIVTEYAFHDQKLNGDMQLADYSMSCCYSYAKQLTGKKIDLIEVRFKHDAPPDISEYNRIFNCKLKFGSSMNAIVGDSEIVNIPIREPNKKLLSVFEKYAKEILSKQTEKSTYTQKVGSLITKMLGEKIPQINMIASKLSISTRSLQTKLQKEGTTYSEILDQIRKNTAAYYLKNETISIAEISYLLGFSEPSVFHRTFKRWTNHSPGEYRKHNNEIPPQ
ncbi:MAG: AraC family transcriptional regulator [Pseudomonadota bacterium]